MLKKNLFILLLIIFAIGWLSLQLPSTSKTALPATANLNDHIKWQLDSVELWSLEASPQKNTQTDQLYLKAQSSHFNESEEKVYFEQPNAFYQSEQNQLALKSNTANLLQNNQLILEGEVEIEKLSTKTVTQNNQLLSEKITYNKQTHMLTSNEKVHYKQDNLTLEAIGLEANLQTGHYHFLSNVKTQYDTQP